jgi:AcrR family transcriptional regulator
VTDKERRRSFILDAAESRIKDKGIEETTMDEIARQADVSKGTLYLYFKNKQELLLGLHNRALSQLVERSISVLSEDKTGLQLLRRIGEEFVDFNTQNFFYMEIFLRYESLLLDDASLQNDEGQECHINASRIFSYITRCIQVGQSDGSISYNGDPKELAVIIWGAGRGLTQLSYMRKNKVLDSLIGDVDLSQQNLMLKHLDLILDSIK